MPRPSEVVPVNTALAVLSRVNLLRENGSLAIDIGGNLAKLLYLQRCNSHSAAPRLVIDRMRGESSSRSLSVYVPALRGTLHFFLFETCRIEEFIKFIRKHWLSSGETHCSRKRIRATGGGSYKYAPMFTDIIGVNLSRLDELTCYVAGLNFLLTEVDNEAYAFVPQPHVNSAVSSPPNPMSQYRPSAPRKEDMPRCRRFISRTPHIFPYLLVNIGSGVSIVKVTAHGKFQRVSGSCLGGGTFWGLSRLLLNCKSFDDVIELTNKGCNANIDMLVRDIYGEGGHYANLGLDDEVIAASFGKVTMDTEDTRPPTSFVAARKAFLRACKSTFDFWLAFLLVLPFIGHILRFFGFTDPFAPRIANNRLSSVFKPQDVALSLLRMVAYNIGQIAYLNARVHGLDRIYFGGNFIREHPHTIADVSFAVDFWSQGKSQALFLKHDGYLGAIGAFIGGESGHPEKVVETTTVTTGSKNGASATPKKRKQKNGIVKPTENAPENRDMSKTPLPNGLPNGVSAASTTPAVPNGTSRANGSASNGKKRGAKKNSAAEAAKPNGIVATAALPHVENEVPKKQTETPTANDREPEPISAEKSRSEGEWTLVSHGRRKRAQTNQS